MTLIEQALAVIKSKDPNKSTNYKKLRNNLRYTGEAKKIRWRGAEENKQSEFGECWNSQYNGSWAGIQNGGKTPTISYGTFRARGFF